MNPPSTPPRDQWLESHVEDCACGECLELDDRERDHHADYTGGIALSGEVGG